MDQEVIASLGQQWLWGKAVLGLLIAARLGGMIAAMPMLTTGLPLRFRILLVALMSLLIIPGVGPLVLTDLTASSIADVGIAAGRELILGMVMGGVVQLLISGIQVAGELITVAAGLQLAQSADPSTGETVPHLSRLVGLLVMTILLASGGHRLLIDAVLSSFQHLPPMSASIDTTMFELVVDHLAIGIESGLRVAAPVVACVLLTNLLVALISRTVPQLNLMAVGLNLNVLAVLVVTALTVGSVGIVFEAELADAVSHLSFR
ncbi:flagellar biosynthetic protein FliR [Roseiconus nitratireducens]|uniref:Flagellar biosynthetic protein FliR n=1 Tax=Roseiconus nitratireducens TaxID=2605748 RepID=A0A5M6DA57_9BACT|nr:flagellar biosynthetic protein FliR [Roseiconus nitratireducens]KAA5544414.1 flagellar biosynthetic protein FliR [Roseiconus nitratireducens]